jgi:hypothetical protein
MSDPSHPAEEPTEPSSVPLAPSDDEALILWMLSLTPTQRLAVAQGFVDSVFALRHKASTKDG